MGQERGRGGRRPGVYRGGDRREAVGRGPRSGHGRHPLETPAAAQAEPAFSVGPDRLAGDRRGSRGLHPLCHLRERRLGDACPIVCLKTDGTELWRADKTFWATEASTPLIVGDTLYVAADNPERVVLVALDSDGAALVAAAESDKRSELGRRRH